MASSEPWEARWGQKSGHLHHPARGWRVKCSVCGWTGYRWGQDCECYEDWVMYCKPWSPGPGCPSNIEWPCPRRCMVDGTTSPSGRIMFLSDSAVRVMYRDSRGEVFPKAKGVSSP